MAKIDELLEKMETKQMKLKELEDQCADLTSANHQLLLQNQDLNNQVKRLTDRLTNDERTLEINRELKEQVTTLTKELKELKDVDIRSGEESI